MFSNSDQNKSVIQSLTQQLAELEKNLSNKSPKESYQEVIKLYSVTSNYNVLKQNIDLARTVIKICNLIENKLMEQEEKNSIKSIAQALESAIKNLHDNSVYNFIPNYTSKGNIIPEPENNAPEKSTPYKPIGIKPVKSNYEDIPKYPSKPPIKHTEDDIPPPPPKDDTHSQPKQNPKQSAYAVIIDQKNPSQQNISTPSQDTVEKKDAPTTIPNKQPESAYGSMQNPLTTILLPTEPHILLDIAINDLPNIAEDDVTRQINLKIKELDNEKEKKMKDLEEKFKQDQEEANGNSETLTKIEEEFNNNKKTLEKSYNDSHQLIQKSADTLIKLDERMKYYIKHTGSHIPASYQQHSTKESDKSGRIRKQTVLGTPKAKPSDLPDFLPLNIDKDCEKIKNIGAGEFGDVELFRYKGQLVKGQRVFDPNILEFCTQALDAQGFPMYVDDNDNVIARDQLAKAQKFHPFYCVAVKIQKKQDEKSKNRLEKEIMALNSASDGWRNEMAALPPHLQKPCPFNIAHGAKFTKDKKEVDGIICKYEAFTFNVQNKKIDTQSYNAEKFLSLLFGPSDNLPTDPNVRQIYESLRQNKDMIMMQIIKSLYDSITTMHEFNILHLDIALRNTLITPILNKDGVAIGVNAKACDYGLARIPDKLGEPLITHAKAGPVHWMNKERLVDVSMPDEKGQKHVITRATDLYSHKIVMHEIMAYALKLPDLHKNIITIPPTDTKVLPAETNFVTLATAIGKAKDDSEQLGWYKGNVKQILSLPTYSSDPEAPLCTNICNRFDGFLDVSLDANNNAAVLDRIYDKYFITTIKDIVTKYQSDKDKAAFLRNVQALVSINTDTTLFSEMQKELLTQCKKLSGLSTSELEETDNIALIEAICTKSENKDILEFKKIQLNAQDFVQVIGSIKREISDYMLLSKAAKEILANPKKEDQARIKQLHLAYPRYDRIKDLIKAQLNAATYAPELEEIRKEALKQIDELDILLKKDVTDAIWSDIKKTDEFVYKEDVVKAANDLSKQLQQISSLLLTAGKKEFNRVHLALIHELYTEIKHTENKLHEFKIKRKDLNLSEFLSSEDFNIYTASTHEFFKENMQALKDKYGDITAYKKTWATINSPQRPLPESLTEEPNVKLTNLLFKYLDAMPGILNSNSLKEYLANPVNLKKCFEQLLISFDQLGKDDEFMKLYKELGSPNIKDVLATAIIYDPSLNDAILSIANKTELLKDITKHFSKTTLTEYKAELQDKISRSTSKSKIKLDKAEVLNSKIVLVNQAIVNREIFAAKRNIIELISHPYLNKAMIESEKDKSLEVSVKKLYEISVIDMTEALIAQDKKLFEAINSRELFNYSSNEKEKYPGITSYINNSTALSMFVADDVVSYKDDNQRMAHIEYWINVADYAINNSDLANYNVFYAIIAGLTTSQAYRLFTADNLTPSVKEKFLALTAITQNNTGSYKAYRDSIAEKKSAIPYFGILSSDSTFAREGNDPTIKALKSQSGKSGAEQLHLAYRENQVLRRYQQQSRAVSNDKFKINDHLNNQISQEDLSLKVAEVKKAITTSLVNVKENPLKPTTIKAIAYQVFAEFLFPGDPLLSKVDLTNVPDSVFGKSKEKIQDIANGKTIEINGEKKPIELTNDEVLSIMNLLRDHGQNVKSTQVKPRSSLPALPSTANLNFKRNLSLLTTLDKYEQKFHPIPVNVEPKKLVLLNAEDIEFAGTLNKLGDYTFASTLPATDAKITKDISYIELPLLPPFEEKKADTAATNLAKETLSELFNDKNKDKNISITPEQVVDYKYFAHQLFTNDEHHLNSTRDLMDEPAISKVAAILYLIKYEPKFFITQDSDSPQLAIVKKNRNNLAKVFLNELAKEDLKKIAELFFEVKDKIPKDIQDELDLLYKLYPERPTVTDLSKNMRHTMSPNYYRPIQPKGRNERGEYSGIYGFQTQYMQDNELKTEEREIHFKQESHVAKSMAEVLAVRCLNKLIEVGAVDKAPTPLIIATAPNVSKINPLMEDGKNIYLGSFYDAKSSGPANQFRDSPHEFIINTEDEMSLPKQADADLTATQSEALDEMSKYFGVSAFVEFAEYIGMNMREKAKEIETLTNDSELEEKPTKNDERLGVIKSAIITDMKQFLTHKDLMRRESLKNSSLEIKLSNCFNEKNELKNADDLKTLIQMEPSYFLKGDYHFRIHQQATTIFNILWQRAYEFGTQKNLENKVIAEVKALLPDLITKADTPDIIERILANKKWRDEVQDIPAIYHKYEEILTKYYNDKLVNNPSIAEMVKKEILDEKTLDNRVLILERWIRLMEKARTDSNEKQGAEIAAQIYKGIKAVSLNPSIKTEPLGVNPLEDPNNPLKNTFAALSKRAKDSLNVMTTKASTEKDVFAKDMPSVNPFAFASTEPSLRTTKPSKIMQDETITRVLHERTAGDQIKEFGFLLDDISKNIDKVMKQLKEAEKASKHDIRLPFFRNKNENEKTTSNVKEKTPSNDIEIKPHHDK